MAYQKYIIGIDEAGRGPLAGPVAVGVVMFESSFNKKLPAHIKDSKKLTHFEREAWFKKIKQWQKENKLVFYVALVSASIIDKKGISFAIKHAIKMCLKKIDADCMQCSVLLDGSLKAPEEFLYQKTIIKGDEKIPIISLASIAAKVTRDKKMTQYAKKYPEYGFEIHKGYGTEKHRKYIEKYGFSDIHRRSFVGKKSILQNK